MVSAGILINLFLPRSKTSKEDKAPRSEGMPPSNILQSLRSSLANEDRPDREGKGETLGLCTSTNKEFVGRKIDSAPSALHGVCPASERHDGTMIHNKSRESENLKIAKSGESRRNSKNISYPAFDEVTKIIEFIRSDGEDLRSKLSSVAPALDSRPIIRDTFKVLNQLRISGLMFFRILLEMNPKLSKSGDVCSMIINNCGWLGDYEVMLSLLEEFKLENICLTQMAFEFLPLFKPSKNSVMESTRRVVDVLNKVGGSCRNSGITALIEKFCSLNSFQMAKFVIQITEMSVSRYNILIRARCKRGQIEEARAIIQEMVELGFLPDATTYNYLLAYLCKNNRMDEACNVLNEMKEKGFHPNAITFEALIFHSSIRGQLDVAADIWTGW
nr:pentatricopeptide repeat-containing protein At1g52640, mitochondrial-like [Ipomoea batatas]